MLRHLMRGRRLVALLALTGSLLAFSSVIALASSAKSVKVSDKYFHPKTLTVGRGTKVTWQWAGVMEHNVTVKTGPSDFHSRTQVRGTFSHTFSRAGTYHLYCTLHPNMKMTVVVR